MTAFRYNPAVLRQYPTVRATTVEVHNVRPGPSRPELTAELAQRGDLAEVFTQVADEAAPDETPEADM
jgi:hypothetical protein